MTVISGLEQLAQFSSSPPPAVTRVVFSEPDMQARTWLKDLCCGAGLLIREDAVGNMFARWPGTDPEAAAVATGSHIDAIPNSGRYDGTVGVLGGLEAIRLLQQSGFRPRCSIELLLFTSEEPTRFGMGCLGSRLLSGALDPAAADLLRDAEGRTLAEIRRSAGYRGGLEDVALAPGCYAAFLELHIEQGPLLEISATALGIVTGIAAPASLRIEIRGEGGHAGAVLMPQRRDALMGAAEIALAVEKAAVATGTTDTVATTGVCDVYPNAVNSIPSRVTLEIDVRDIHGSRRDSVVQAISQAATRTAAERRLSITTAIVNADPPAHCDDSVVAALEQASDCLGLSRMRIISRAYHDSLFMSRLAPTAMLFIPCRGGVSHRADEYAAPEDIANGVRALAEALRLLSS
jgi:N-carbamoyl-L-amino-acid hydrolase